MKIIFFRRDRNNEYYLRVSIYNTLKLLKVILYARHKSTKRYIDHIQLYLRDFITGKTYSGWAITGYFLDADLITFQNSFIKPISTTVSLNMKTIRWHK